MGHGSCYYCSCTYCRQAPEPKCAFHNNFVPNKKKNILIRYVKVRRFGSEKDVAIYENVAKNKGVTREELLSYWNAYCLSTERSDEVENN